MLLNPTGLKIPSPFIGPWKTPEVILHTKGIKHEVPMYLLLLYTSYMQVN